MNVTVKPVVIEKILKGFVRGLKELEIEEGAETIRTAAGCQNTEKSPGDEEACCHSYSRQRPSADADVKNMQ